MKSDNKKEAFKSLNELFNQYAPFSNEAWKYLKSKSKLIQAKKNQIIINLGATDANLFYIYKGVVRGYFIEDGREITTWIDEENEFSGAIHSLSYSISSSEVVQAIEDSVLIQIPLEAIDHIYEEYPETNKVGRLILTKYYVDAEERAALARISSAEERYRRFMSQRAGLTNRISLKHIASFLNMNLETLSRIRSKRL